MIFSVNGSNLLCLHHDSWKDNDLRVALIGKQVDLSYEYEVDAFFA